MDKCHSAMASYAQPMYRKPAHILYTPCPQLHKKALTHPSHTTTTAITTLIKLLPLIGANQ